MITSITKNYLDQLARTISHDPDTQTAAIIVDAAGFMIVSEGNRMPLGVQMLPDRLKKPEKYKFIEHAERYAIAKAARMGLRTSDGTMYLNWFPCVDCARAIVVAGISRLYCDKERYEARKDDPRYAFKQSMDILTEAGVKVEWL
jgi:dCMP deaminase